MDDKQRIDAEVVVPIARDHALKRRFDLSTKVQFYHNVAISCKGRLYQDENTTRALPDPKEDQYGFWAIRRENLAGMVPVPKVRHTGCGYGMFSDFYNCDVGYRYHRHNGPNFTAISEPLETIVVLTQPQWGAYYHFVVDALSRLTWVREQHPMLLQDSNTRYHTGLTNEIGQSWARLVGIDTELVEGRNKLLEGWWRAKTAVYPPTNDCNNQRKGAHPHAIEMMQSMVGRSIAATNALLPAPQGAKPMPTLLLVRRDPRASKVRAVLNYDDMFAAVKAEFPGWNILEFSDFPKAPDVATTCSMFNRADMIVGPHGAGFSNLMCAKAGVPVVEFKQAPHSPDFEIFTMKLGMPYLGVPTGGCHLCSYNVDVPTVMRAVRIGKAVAGGILGAIGNMHLKVSGPSPDEAKLQAMIL